MGEVLSLSLDNGEVVGAQIDFGEGEAVQLLGDEIEMICSTGLSDKDGKEIWEGDIVNLRDGEDIIGRGVFIWDGKEAGFVHTWEEWTDGKPTGYHRPTKKLWLSASPKIEFEVIGNVFENPEILEK
jgi:uncharacterized phage protein (TIGR01671 family)